MKLVAPSKCRIASWAAVPALFLVTQVSHADVSVGVANLITTRVHAAAERVTDVGLPEDSINIAFQPTSNRLSIVPVTGSPVREWNWHSVLRPDNSLAIHGSTRLNKQDGFAYSSDGRLLALAYKGISEEGFGVVRIWDAASSSEVHTITEESSGDHDGGIVFSQNNQVLIRRVHAIEGDQVIAYDTRTWNRLWGIRTFPFMPECMAISRNGQFLALGGGTREASDITSSIAIVDISTHQLARWIPAFSASRMIDVIDWSANGDLLVAGSTSSGAKLSETLLMLFNATTGERRAEEKGVADGVYSARFTPDGKYLVVARTNHSLEIWDSAHTSLKQVIPLTRALLAVSADSRYLGMAVRGQVSIWQIN